MSNGIKPSWPGTFYTKRKGDGPARQRRDTIRQLDNEKARQTRRGIIAEIMAEQKREIEDARNLRDKVRREREAIDSAVAGLPSEARCKIVRNKDGSISLKRKDRGEKGKFLPSVKIVL